MPMTDLSNVEGLECLFGRKFTGAEWDEDEDEFILDFNGKILRIRVDYDEEGMPKVGLYTEREDLN